MPWGGLTWIIAACLLALTPGAAFSSAAALEEAVREGVPQVVREMPSDASLRAADERRAMLGHAPHFAAPIELESALWGDFAWDLASPRVARARLLVEVPSARSLSLAFSRVELPPGATLRIVGLSGAWNYGSASSALFSSATGSRGRALWTPPLRGDRVLIEATVPFARFDALRLDLERAHGGYVARGPAPPLDSAAPLSCQQDLACLESAKPAMLEGSAWSRVARSVGRVTVDGVRFCTGFLVANTRADARPLFVTARHCGIGVDNAASVVVEWGAQSADCSAEAASEEIAPGEIAEGTAVGQAETAQAAAIQNGAVVRALHPATDLVLLELLDPPPPGAVFAGWDRSDQLPRRTAVLHHPGADRQRLTIDLDRPQLSGHLEPAGADPPSATDHLRIEAWDVGTTEGGSSGAPLLDVDGRALGWLRGGYAACGVAEPDWFGRLAAAWDGPTANRRLRDWLDPLGTEAWVLDPYEADTPPDAPPRR